MAMAWQKSMVMRQVCTITMRPTAVFVNTARGGRMIGRHANLASWRERMDRRQNLQHAKPMT